MKRPSPGPGRIGHRPRHRDHERQTGASGWFQRPALSVGSKSPQPGGRKDKDERRRTARLGSAAGRGFRPPSRARPVGACKTRPEATESATTRCHVPSRVRDSARQGQPSIDQTEPKDGESTRPQPQPHTPLVPLNQTHTHTPRVASAAASLSFSPPLSLLLLGPHATGPCRGLWTGDGHCPEGARAVWGAGPANFVAIS